MNTLLFALTNYAIISHNNKQTQLDFNEKSLWSKSYIIKDDKLGCGDDLVNFHRKMLMSKYDIGIDDITIFCDSVIDHKGLKYTKWYKEIKLNKNK